MEKRVEHLFAVCYNIYTFQIASPIPPDIMDARTKIRILHIETHKLLIPLVKYHLTSLNINGIVLIVVVLRSLRGAWPVEFHAWAPLFLYPF